MQKTVDLKSTSKQPQPKKFDAEVVRQYIVDKHKRDPNAKHIEKAASQIKSQIDNFNGPTSGRSAKNIPNKKISESSKDMKMDEAKSSMARPKSRMDIIRAASKKAAERSADPRTKPGSTPSWINQASKMKKEEVESVEEQMVSNRILKMKKTKETHHMRDAAASHALTSRVSRIQSFHTGMTKRNEEVEQVDEKMNDDQKKAVKSALDYRKDIGMKSSTTDAKKIIKFVKNEEIELEEGRGRPPKVGSKAWHAKQASIKSGEGEEQEADKNIVNQMRKKPIGDHHSLVFNNGEKKQVHVKHVNKALSMLANTPKPADREKLQNSLSHSHDRFIKTVEGGKAIEDSARPKVSLAKSAAKPMKEEKDSDMKAQKTRIEVINGKPTLVKYTPQKSDVKVEAVTYYDPAHSEEAEEKKEGQAAPKGTKVDMTKDSCDRMQSMSPQAFKQKFKVPPTAGNVAPGGEDATYGKGKFSVAEEKTLNNLYVNLSEENKEIFEQMVQSEEGIVSLLDFARKQGF